MGQEVRELQGELPVGDLIGVAVCLVFSAFFSGTETALTALSDRRTQQAIDQGGRLNQVLQSWIDRPTRVLTTLLVGNNLVNIIGSVLAARIAHSLLDSYADAVAVGAMTLVVLVLGEVTPKTFAKHNPIRVAVPAMYLVRVFELLFFPVAWVLARFGGGLIRVAGGVDALQAPTVTEGDIEYLLELGQREGVFQEEERAELIASVLEFGETIAKEAMVPRTEAHFLPLDLSLQEAVELLVGWGHSRVPVYETTPDQLVGLLYAKDVLRVTACADPPVPPLATIMRSNLLFIPETQKISDTLRLMRTSGQHLGIVLDEFGGTAGIITMEDILEELVGEIRDEFDGPEEEELQKLEEDHYIADAGMDVFELGEELGEEIPDDGEYETLGGFLTSQLGRVPVAGDQVVLGTLHFSVTEADPRRVISVDIVREEAEEG